MYKCAVCNKRTHASDIKYHTADKTKIFCGAECSLKYHLLNREEK
tara:strand:+ start:199 stop:333 length:135 start_codon:yes stop_codon:yes gene_type:complete